jgi:acyl carrier protein
MIFAVILADEFGGRVSLDDMIDDAQIDSLEYLEFIKRLEDEFQIRLPDEEVAKAGTFKQLSVIVDRLRHAEFPS